MQYFFLFYFLSFFIPFLFLLINMNKPFILPQNIDFMPTILSRFDMIFIIKDEHDEARDMVSL